jgi:hypothetical protein
MKVAGRTAGISVLALVVGVACMQRSTWAPGTSGGADTGSGFDSIVEHARHLMDEGRTTFRSDTFGSEGFWGGALQLHRPIAGEKNGGVGPGLSPKQALALGLKVDFSGLPAALVEALMARKVDLDDPASTIALLKANVVMGVTGFFDSQGRIVSIGIQCALCHSTVDDGFAQGIGRRLDGWPNRDLDIGAIVALAPTLKPYTDLLGADDSTVRKGSGAGGRGSSMLSSPWNWTAKRSGRTGSRPPR